MAHLRAAVNVAVPREARFRDLLYKADHPRRIDQFIDFFGDGASRRAGAADCCGDLLLGSLA